MLTKEQEREYRTKELIQDYGCLPEEASEWSAIDFHAPNISPFITQFFGSIRREYELYFRRYGRYGMGSYQSWKDAARRNYINAGCIKDGIGKPRPHVWKRLHDLEDAWLLLNPDYLREKLAYREDKAQRKRNLNAAERAVHIPVKPARKYTNRRR